MQKKKKIIIVIAAVLLAAALLGVWYFGVKRPADKAAAAAADLKSITVNVTHSDGSEKTLSIETARVYLSEALLDEELMVGEDQGYGLTIVSLDGEEALIANNASWVFNVNGEMGMNSVDQTILADGDVFDFYVLTW